MSRNRTKENVTKNKNEAIGKIDYLLTNLTNSDDEKLLKRADLISYWIKDFAKYIEYEDQFNPKKLISYSRGDVIRVNFGFRVGSEFGGLHYAVVIDNANSQSSNVVTVIPLSSTDGKTVHRNNVDLGSELYHKINDQQRKLIAKTSERIKECSSLIKASNELPIMDIPTQNLTYLTKKHFESIKLLETLKKYDKEINRLKNGSMAIVNQITTVSKQRIYVPKKSLDYLYGIKLSTSALDKINDKLKSLFLR